MEEIIQNYVKIPIWRQILLDPRTIEILGDSYDSVGKLIEKTEKKEILQPAKENIFRALNYFPPGKCNVVICGQDPYPEPGRPSGLAFATADGTVPKSLLNIYKEIRLEYGLDYKPNIDRWPRQGVLLLNAVLTGEIKKRRAHNCPEWIKITDYIIKVVNKLSPKCVFMLWGSDAHEKSKLIDESKHLILTTSHPSPLSATKTDSPFIGSGVFKKCNEFLGDKKSIIW